MGFLSWAENHALQQMTWDPPDITNKKHRLFAVEDVAFESQTDGRRGKDYRLVSFRGTGLRGVDVVCICSLGGLEHMVGI